MRGDHMHESWARVPTAAAARYLAQICKHFAHKITVDYDASRGRAEFPFGVCELAVEDDALVMRCRAPDREALDRIEHVVAVHLERFAWREKPVVSWQASSGGGKVA